MGRRTLESLDKTARVIKFNFRSEFGRLCEHIPLSEAEANDLGVPHPAILLLPVQSRVEEWIFQKYVQYKRNYSAETILENIEEQLDIAASVTKSIHPDYKKVFDQIFADLFGWKYIPGNTGFKVQPVRKFCTKCDQLKPVDQFDPAYYTADYLSVFCRPCTARKQAAKLRQQSQAITPLPLKPLSVTPSADKLDNPDHDIDFDNLPSASEPDYES